MDYKQLRTTWFSKEDSIMIKSQRIVIDDYIMKCV